MRTRHGECDVRRAVPEVARITSGYGFLKLALPHTTVVLASEALASPRKLSLVELVNCRKIGRVPSRSNVIVED